MSDSSSFPCTKLSRRTFGVAASCSFLAASKNSLGQDESSAIKPKELQIETISQDARFYCGWPTLTRRSSGELLLVWSGGREAHVCPFGRVEMMRSQDDGQTWSWPRTLLDGPMDDRDAGIMETAKGTLLATTFTSDAYWHYYLKQAVERDGTNDAWPEAKYSAWMNAHNRISDEQRSKELGQWMIRSTDGGVTWSSRYSSIVNSPHGPIQLSDGRLLYAGKELWTGSKRVGVCQSTDDGQSWQWLADMPVREGDSWAEYHELHAVESPSGKLIAHIRNQNKNNDRETLQSESTDGGKTWSVPHTIGVWGLPSFLLRLRDGRILMTYGHRRGPLGNQARVSEDEGVTWNAPYLVSSDATSGDLGYPSTVELDDGSLLTVWYEKTSAVPMALLRQARWKI
ncbi:MAG: sialidase family protein [Planctomycetota bacterium]